MAVTNAGLWDVIADEAARESELWASALVPNHRRQPVAVFSPLGEERFALGLETIYEGYLLHYGRPRLFAPADADTRVLLGDYLYAHGLVRIADLGDVDAVADLAELLSVCAHLRADGRPGDGPAWAAAVALLGEWRREACATDATGWRHAAERAAGHEAVARALAVHAERVS